MTYEITSFKNKVLVSAETHKKADEAREALLLAKLGKIRGECDRIYYDEMNGPLTVRREVYDLFNGTWHRMIAYPK